MSSQIQTPRAYLERLPNEIVLLILENISLQDLSPLLVASDKIRELFYAYQRQIVASILVRRLGPVVVDAIMLQELDEVAKAEDTNVQWERLGRYAQDSAAVTITGPIDNEGLASLTRGWIKDMASDQLFELCKLAQYAEAFAELFASIWRGTMENRRSNQTPYHFPRSNLVNEDMFLPLSDMERRRLVQAFLRAEILVNWPWQRTRNIGFIPECDLDQAYLASGFLTTVLRHVDPATCFHPTISPWGRHGVKQHLFWEKLHSIIMEPGRRQQVINHFTAPGRRHAHHAFGSRQGYKGEWITLHALTLSKDWYQPAKPVLGVPDAWLDATVGFNPGCWGPQLSGFAHGNYARQQAMLWGQFPLAFWDKQRLDKIKPALFPRMRTGWMKDAFEG